MSENALIILLLAGILLTLMEKSSPPPVIKKEPKLPWRAKITLLLLALTVWGTGLLQTHPH